MTLSARRSVCRLAVGLALALPAAAGTRAADRPYGQGDVALGAGYEALAAVLDFRGIDAAGAEQAARRAARPDFGRRGFGCYRRGDAYADVTCVSHEERVGGAPTREVRLQFLDGVLQQFSITADLPHLQAVVGALEAAHGPPQETEAASGARYASWRWRNAVSTITAWAGRDVVFVSFELAGYAAAVRRPPLKPGQIVVEPR